VDEEAKLVGAIQLVNKRSKDGQHDGQLVNGFTAEDEVLLPGYAVQVACAVVHAGICSKVVRSANQEARLASACLVLSRCRVGAPQEMFATVSTEGARLADCEKFTLYVLDPIKVGGIRGTFSGHSVYIQGTFRVHSGYIQGTCRAHSRNMQGTFQGTFREHSGNMQ
jgi:hypothetical protein